MKVLVIYDDGKRVFVRGETWLDVIQFVGCSAISLTVVDSDGEEIPVKNAGEEDS